MYDTAATPPQQPMHETNPAALSFHTQPLRNPVDLLSSLPGRRAPSKIHAWTREGNGKVGWGQVASVATNGPRRFSDAEHWWRQVVTRAEVTSTQDSGRATEEPLAFGSFAFADDSEHGGLLTVPQVILRREGEQCLLTTVVDTLTVHTTGELRNAHRQLVESFVTRHQATDTSRRAPASPGETAFSDGAHSGPSWQAAVADAVEHISRTDLDKVVLARDLHVETENPLSVRWLLRRLAADYTPTWVFAVDGLVGATPEMLCRLEKGLVTSRVLAGTIRRTGDDERDLALSASLARSSKDLEEHEYAVRSVAESLTPHCTSLNIPETPFVLHLPNVMHLATDVTGWVSDSATSLSLAAALHPSAAVCGTPRQLASQTITELEKMDRGRYSGPVGWIDASGDGEWGVALRCGALDPEDTRQMRIFAGCGIVAGSDPAAELAESDAKLVPMRSALAPGPLAP
ncbi:isochorismate synthase [Austwickia chelonae]|uniref:isochorismate synthase n=1 Tax=Austwickia chelonae NBRC 105200 TaxID=1184607 RepID=K6VMX0_9MICO|nr:putative isochorismate synthase [Austwickia chelonae NBRC 105200]